MRTIVLDGESLGFADLRALSRDFLQRDVRLKIAPPALNRVARSRAVVERAIRDGRTIYGINTGFGQLADTRIDAARLEELQERLLLSHSAGMGLPIHEVGVMIALRANALLIGYSGVTPALVRGLEKGAAGVVSGSKIACCKASSNVPSAWRWTMRASSRDA